MYNKYYTLLIYTMTNNYNLRLLIKENEYNPKYKIQKGFDILVRI